MRHASIEQARKDYEANDKRLKAEEVFMRINEIARDVIELRMLRSGLPSATTPMTRWLHSCLDNKELELKQRARVLADSLKPLPQPGAKRQRKA